MARVYAADDFDAIRARLAEIRRERSERPVKKAEMPDQPRPFLAHTAPGRRLLREFVMTRRLRGGGRIVLSVAKS
jgi:hypothetical protein